MADGGAVEPWAPGSADPKIAFAEFQMHLREITPRVRVMPTVFALNVLVFVAMVATGVSALGPTPDVAVAWGANYGPLTLSGQPWRLVTNFFVHFGVIHLAANMFVLWNAGAIVERLFGPLAFAALYLAAGLTASLLSLAVHPTVVSAGASGAVFGVYGALAAFVLLKRGTIPKVVISRLGGVAGSFIAYNLFFGAAHAGIDNAAHIGGLLGGFAAGAFLIRPLVLDRPNEPRRPALTAAAAIVLAGVVVLVMPRPLDFQAIVRDFGASESTIIDRYNATTGSLGAHKIDMAQAADQIEQTVLPPWRDARSKLESQAQAWRRKNHATYAQEHLIALLVQVDKVRETGWTQMVAALRRGDGRAAAAAAHETEGTVRGLQKVMENVNP